MSKAMSPSKPISLVRRARAELRRALNQSELTMLEEIALQSNRGSVLRILRGSYLAACLGVSRQWANNILRRLEKLGLILRFKTGLVRLNLEKLNKISARPAKLIRRKMRNALKNLLKSGRGNTGFPNKKKYTSKEDTSLQIYENMTRSESRAALDACYIPVHLRQHQ